MDINETMHARARRGDGLGPLWMFWRRRRYYVAIMACLGYVNSYATRANLSVAIVMMTELKNVTLTNGTVVQEADFDWDQPTQGLILAGFFYGYIVTQILGGYLAGVLGGNHVINIGVLGSGLLSFIIPPVSSSGPTSVIVIRVICGLLQGVIIPAAHGIWIRWAPPLETTILSGLAISGNFLSPVIVMPLCEVIGHHLGWPWIFHVFGLTSVAWSVLWFFTVSGAPDKDRCIKQGELSYIEESIGERTDVKVKHPWLKFFLSLPVWAIVVAQTGHNWGFYTLLLYGPKYYNEALRYNIKLSGTLTGVAFAILGILLQIFGPVSDFLRTRQHLNTIRTRKWFTCGGLAIQTVFMLVPVSSSNRTFIAVSLVLAIGFGGVTWAGFSVNHLDIAPPHAAVLLGISNTFATISGIIMPAVAGCVLTKDSVEPEDWYIIWLICALVYIFSLFFFVVFAQGDKQSWIFIVQSEPRPPPPEEETEDTTKDKTG